MGWTWVIDRWGLLVPFPTYVIHSMLSWWPQTVKFYGGWRWHDECGHCLIVAVNQQNVCHHGDWAGISRSHILFLLQLNFQNWHWMNYFSPSSSFIVSFHWVGIWFHHHEVNNLSTGERTDWGYLSHFSSCIFYPSFCESAFRSSPCDTFNYISRVIEIKFRAWSTYLSSHLMFAPTGTVIPHGGAAFVRISFLIRTFNHFHPLHGGLFIILSRSSSSSSSSAECK